MDSQLLMTFAQFYFFSNLYLYKFNCVCVKIKFNNNNNNDWHKNINLASKKIKIISIPTKIIKNMSAKLIF